MKLELILTVLTIIGIVFKTSLVIYKWVCRKIESISKVHSQVDVIFKEITPNGGGSIKDKVNAMSLEMINNTKLTEHIFQRQRWMMDQRTEPIFETNLQGEYIWVNKQFAMLVERDMGTLMGHNWKNTVYEEDRDRVVSNWNSSIKDKRSFEDEYRLITSTGKIIRVSVTATNTCGEYIGSLKQIT